MTPAAPPAPRPPVYRCVQSTLAHCVVIKRLHAGLHENPYRLVHRRAGGWAASTPYKGYLSNLRPLPDAEAATVLALVGWPAPRPEEIP